MPDRRPRRAASEEAGIALIMVVIFSVLLFVVVADLVTSAQLTRSTGLNDALQVRMDNHMSLTRLEVEQGLKDDLEGGEGEGAAGALPGGTGGEGNPLGGGATGEGAGAGPGGEQKPASDTLNDPWAKPTPYSDGELTTYAWVEDENRKFNLLSLASPDAEFAEESKDRLVRLIRGLRAHTLFEISHSDATTIAEGVVDWLKGLNRDDLNRPRPPLKSDDEKEFKKTIPLHLEELLLLRGVDETIYYDLVMEGPPVRMLPGLESVLTIYTSYRTDPGDPDQVARANANAPGRAAGANPGAAGQGGSGEGGTPGGAGQGGAGEGATNPGGEAPPEPEGLGIKVNINTASRHVLRCLLTEVEFPNNVLDAILRHRNEDAPEEEGQEGQSPIGEYTGDVRMGEERDKKVFSALEDLEELPEFASLDPQIKEKFLALITTQSDVFTIHLACLHKKSEEKRIFVMSRRKSVVVRLEGEESPRLYYIIRMERTHGLRIKDVDFPEEEAQKRLEREIDMDDFAIEERAWNPFLIEFYEKRDEARKER